MLRPVFASMRSETLSLAHGALAVLGRYCRSMLASPSADGTTSSSKLLSAFNFRDDYGATRTDFANDIFASNFFRDVALSCNPIPDHNQFINKNPKLSVPSMNVLLLVVGTRGDVAPFIQLGQSLIGYGHRVRLATHECFRSFVMAGGLEFYPLVINV